MNNPRMRFSLVLFSVALAAAAVAGQQSQESKPGQSGGRHIPCWKQVGISPAAMEQRRAIMEGARTKVQGVCKDDSLTAEQKKEQIHEIRKAAMQQAEGLISPGQQEALKKCEHEQSASNGSHPARTTGPCGEPLEPEEPGSPSNAPTSN
jgi:hypothetical protein